MGFVTNLALLVVATFTIVFGGTEMSPKSYTKEYGEPCNLIEKCNYRHWLKCANGVCQCSHPEQMLFMSSGTKSSFSFFTTRATLMEKKSCRARINQSCKRDKFTDDDNNLITAPPLTRPQEGSTPKQTQLCVDNSYCHSHGLCRCNIHYAMNPTDGTCQKYREYSHPCERDAECHPDHFLKCRRGLCSCDPVLRYDHASKKCTAGPGDKCVLSLSRRGKLINNCAQNGTCHLGECKCARGYIADYKLRVCSRDYEYYCDERQPCVDNWNNEYICSNSSCICNQTPLPSLYDKQSRRCLRLKSIGRIVQPPVSAFKLILTFLASLLL